MCNLVLGHGQLILYVFVLHFLVQQPSKIVNIWTYFSDVAVTVTQYVHVDILT